VSAWLDPTQTDISTNDIGRLATVIGTDRRDLARKLNQYAHREFMYIKRRVSPQLAEQIAAARHRRCSVRA